MQNLPFVIALMVVLYVMSQRLGKGACVSCGKQLRHAPDCPSQKGRS